MPFEHNFAPFKHRELLLIILIIVRFFFVKTETNLKIAKPDRLFIIFDFYFGGKIRKCVYQVAEGYVLVAEGSSLLPFRFGI